MPKIEINLDDNTLKNAEKYAASNAITVEEAVVNALRRRANASARRKG